MEKPEDNGKTFDESNALTQKLQNPSSQVETEDTDIIDLTEIVDFEGKKDDDIIELTEAVELEDTLARETGDSGLRTTDPPAVSETRFQDGQGFEVTTDAEPVIGSGFLADRLHMDNDIRRDFIDTEGVSESDGLSEVQPAERIASIPTQDQIEVALEKVVRTIYAEKIESLLVDVVQRVVREEITRVKKLLGEDPEGEKP